MATPLPKREVGNPDFNTGNRGLIFNKFFNKWPEDYSELRSTTERNPKLEWLKKIAAASHQQELPDRKPFYDAIGATSIDFTLTEPLVCGMGYEHPVENGFFFHHTTGLPVIPGSSLKGLLRHWLTVWEPHEDLADHLCGKDRAGSVIFFDMFPITPPQLAIDIVTPHIGSWRLDAKSPPADWISPTPIPFLTVAPGSTFRLAIAPRGNGTDKDVQTAHEHLSTALAELGIGARTSRGMGRMESSDKKEERARKQSLTVAVGNYVRVRDVDGLNKKQQKFVGKLARIISEFGAQGLWKVKEFNTDMPEKGAEQIFPASALEPVPKPDDAL